jgi:hypothetical protein
MRLKGLRGSGRSLRRSFLEKSKKRSENNKKTLRRKSKDSKSRK